MVEYCNKCKLYYLDTHYSDYFKCEHKWIKIMNFSEALEQIKSGEVLKRLGWNGKNQYVFLVNGSQFVVNRAPLNNLFPEGTNINYRPHIDMKYEDGSIGVWFPSMGDIMAEDWSITHDR